MIEQNLGEALGERLSGHATLLHRWLDALHERAGRSRIYLLFEQAMKERKQIACVYDGYRREAASSARSFSNIPKAKKKR